MTRVSIHAVQTRLLQCSAGRPLIIFVGTTAACSSCHSVPSDWSWSSRSYHWKDDGATLAANWVHDLVQTMCHHACCSVRPMPGLYPRSHHASIITPWSEHAYSSSLWPIRRSTYQDCLCRTSVLSGWSTAMERFTIWHSHTTDRAAFKWALKTHYFKLA